MRVVTAPTARAATGSKAALAAKIVRQARMQRQPARLPRRQSVLRPGGPSSWPASLCPAFCRSAQQSLRQHAFGGHIATGTSLKEQLKMAPGLCLSSLVNVASQSCKRQPHAGPGGARARRRASAGFAMMVPGLPCVGGGCMGRAPQRAAHSSMRPAQTSCLCACFT